MKSGTVEPWQEAYMYYKNPDLDHCAAHKDQIAAALNKTNYRTKEALAFKYGWQSGLEALDDKFTDAYLEVSSDD